MKKLVLTGMVAAALALAATANAGTVLTCRVAPSLCDGGGDGGGSGRVSVPEPATLTLLVAGFGAAGFAAWKRRKNKK
jgi:hypothetical protein